MEKKITITLFLLLFLLKIAAQDLIPFEKNGLWGYQDEFGNEIITPEYQLVMPFIEDYAKVYYNDSIGIINRKNEMIIPTKYNRLTYLGKERFVFGYRATYVGDYDVGLMTARGEVLLEPEFREIKVKNGYLEVKRTIEKVTGKSSVGDIRSIQSLYGIYDIDGNELIAPNQTTIRWLSNEHIALKKGYEEALFLANGEQLTDYKYKIILPFSNNRAKVLINKKRGYLNTKGEEVIAPIFKQAYIFSDGLAVVKMEDKEGVIDTLGNLVLPYQYEKLEVYSRGVFTVKEGDLYGLMDRNGNIVEPIRYEAILRAYGCGIAFKTKGKWRIYNLQKRKFYKGKYDSVRLLELNEAKVHSFDFKGIPKKRYKEFFFIVRKNETEALVSENGNQLTNFTSGFRYTQQEIKKRRIKRPYKAPLNSN